MRHRVRPIAVSTALSLALGVIAAAHEPQDPHDPSPAPLTKRELDALVDDYFAADAATRRALEAKLGAHDAIAPAEVEGWKARLLKLARASGRRCELEGSNWFFAEQEPKSGRYLVQGKSGKALVLGLHGGGEGEGDASSAMSGLGGALGGAKAIAVYPEVLEKTEYGWGEEATERFVLDLIAAIRRSRPVDTNRVYLAGHSMGGYGAWTLGGRHADEFAGLAAFAGAPTPIFATGDVAQAKVVAIEEGILPNLRNLPIFVYQSLDDPRVPPPANQFAVNELRALAERYGGYAHVYEEVDGRGHAFPAKGPGPGVAWAMEHVRDPRPKRIVWQPARAWKRMFYWLWWDEPVLGAVLDVEVVAKNRVEVRAAPDVDLSSLSILVDERLFDLEQEIVVTVHGAERFRGVVRDSLSTLLRTAAERNDPELLFRARIDLGERTPR